MAYLILVRHGQSFWNKEGYNCFTGWVDVADLPRGVKDLIKAGKILEDFHFDVAFTSELYRGVETVMITLSHNKVSGTPIIIHKKGRLSKWSKFYHKDFGKFVPVIKSWRLNERYYGRLQGMNKDKARKRFGEEKVLLWRRSYDIPPPGGESLKDVVRRISPVFYQEMVPLLKKEKNILVGAHGNTIRALVTIIDNLKPEDVLHLEIKKGAPLLYRYSRGKFINLGYIKSKENLEKKIKDG